MRPTSEDPLFEEYMDVLHNLEFAILHVARDDSEVLDLHIDAALEGAIRYYRAEESGRKPRDPRLGPGAKRVYEALKAMAEFHLGRAELPFGHLAEPAPDHIEPIMVEELIPCFKRIRKSVQFWTDMSGRRGYVNYVKQFVK